MVDAMKELAQLRAAVPQPAAEELERRWRGPWEMGSPAGGGGSDRDRVSPRFRPARRSRLARAGLGVAVAAALAAAAVAAPRVLPDRAGRRAVTPMDARTFLLASADRALRLPARTGAFWYSDTRSMHIIGAAPLKGERSPIQQRRRKPARYQAVVTETHQTWWARRGPSRTVGPQQVRIGFLTPRDEAIWRSLGSPSFKYPTRSVVRDEDTALVWPIGDRRMTLGQLAALPADPAELQAMLERSYRSDPAGSGFRALSDFIWAEAGGLLQAPISPGARAAVYRVLVKLPGVHLVGTVSDPLGRKGVALTRTERGPDGPGERRLIIDPAGSRLLADELLVQRNGQRVMWMWLAVRASGWTSRLGVPAQD